jgi:hypothetical protein
MNPKSRVRRRKILPHDRLQIPIVIIFRQGPVYTLRYSVTNTDLENIWSQMN